MLWNAVTSLERLASLACANSAIFTSNAPIRYARIAVMQFVVPSRLFQHFSRTSAIQPSKSPVGISGNAIRLLCHIVWADTVGLEWHEAWVAYQRASHSLCAKLERLASPILLQPLSKCREIAALRLSHWSRAQKMKLFMKKVFLFIFAQLRDGAGTFLVICDTHG